MKTVCKVAAIVCMVAIFVHRLYWWVRDNAANGRNYRDGRYWTYDSLNALTEIFPCWSRRQIEGIINTCAPMYCTHPISPNLLSLRWNPRSSARR